MDLTSSLSIASSGLSAVQHELGVASQNVANAGTPGYVTEIANVSSRDAGGNGAGVVVQLTTRAVNDTLQNALYAQNALVSGLGVTTNGLNAVSSAQGSTSATAGSNGTLSDTLGTLSNGFTTLQSDPSSATQQQSVVQSAQNVASSIRTLSQAYQTQRQNAQAAIVSEVSTVNSTLQTIGSLSKMIVQANANGKDTADLANQRAAAMSSLSQVMSVKFTETSTGDMRVATADGLLLPTGSESGNPSNAPGMTLTTQTATIGATDAHPGTIPSIMLYGRDVTSSLTGGTLGANLKLRDSTLPTMQGELDSYAATLASRFSAQGLTLFTDANGNLPGTNPGQTAPAGQLGYSATIQVSSAVSATPSSVRDGSQAIQDPTAGATIVPGAVLTGASAFTPNPAGGPVGFTTLISRVLNNALGTSIVAGTAQPAAAVSGLGAGGAFSAPYSGTGSLATLASTLTGSQALTISQATSQQTAQSDIQTALQASVTSSSSVSVDSQMANVVSLQNSYEANAKVVSAIQSMFSALLAAVH